MIIFADVESERRLSLSGLREQVLKMGGLLKQEYQWQAGDVLAVCANNDMDYAVSLLAAHTIGGVASAIDHHYSVYDMAACLRIIKPKIIVADEKTRNKASQVACLLGITHGVVTFRELQIKLQNMTPAQPTRYTPEQLDTTPAYYYFTSGTSDVKKAVIMTQRNAVAALFGRATRSTSAIRILCHIEMHHVSQLFQACHFPIRQRSSVYFLSEFAAGQPLDRFWAAIEKYSITVISVYPWLAKQLVDDAKATNYDLSSLQIAPCIGAPIDKSITQKLYKRMNLKCINIYGMTESGPVFQSSWEATLEGSPGTLARNVSAKLVDPDDQKEVGPGEVGELYIKSPQCTLGYLDNPSATKALFDADGYLRTGDIFRMSEDGRFYYVCRFKDRIRYDDMQMINPRNIEDIVKTHPLVDDCLVMGVHNNENGNELATAFVELSKESINSSTLPSHQAIKDSIQMHVESQVSEMWHLCGGIYIVNAFPRTPLGKVRRMALYENYIRNQSVKLLQIGAA
ncbi:hypothetical protein BCR43DRAFT_482292 [Syncephalastrum racemosum]|uniref:AMP-dependent synthetase/ligase domain-containing protein n=1 Tax=Syncephalastrum racemosum TaxID=13706 RepID=A0A1X2HTD9_SYNRA|nr:hypothetical protein BCR43DRAFT_482292 [Syncephalastrum racemosum]